MMYHPPAKFQYWIVWLKLEAPCLCALVRLSTETVLRRQVRPQRASRHWIVVGHASRVIVSTFTSSQASFHKPSQLHNIPQATTKTISVIVSLVNTTACFVCSRKSLYLVEKSKAPLPSVSFLFFLLLSIKSLFLWSTWDWIIYFSVSLVDGIVWYLFVIVLCYYYVIIILWEKNGAAEWRKAKIIKRERSPYNLYSLSKA